MTIQLQALRLRTLDLLIASRRRRVIKIDRLAGWQ